MTTRKSKNIKKLPGIPGERPKLSKNMRKSQQTEQKMKCICWEMATNDYEYRYKYLKKNYGECSDYNSKNSVYSDIIQQITKLNPDFSIYFIMENIEITNEEQEEIRNNYINKEINKGIKNDNKKRKLELCWYRFTNY